MDAAELATQCLQVVSAIRCEIISRGSACNLGRILVLLRQALQLAVLGQATGEEDALAESGEVENQAMLPASGGPAVDSPPGLPLADESMDLAGSPTVSSSPVGQPQADVEVSDAGDRESTPPVLPPLRRPPPQSPTSTPVRPSRGAGGSQRSYVVRQHFIHGETAPWGICSLEHVPKKKPDALVRYGTQEDTANSVALIADMLHTKQCLKASKSELLEALLQVADVTTICCPEDDDSRPSGCGEQALDDWDCAAAVRHIQSLLLLPKSLEVLSNYQIGQYLKHLANDGSHDAVNALIAHLCSRAASTEVRQYRSILTHCGCSECLQDNSWLDATSQEERSSPCAGTEVRAKCLHDTYKGFEPTQLRQCVMMAEAVPTNHPLLFAQNVPSAARVRQLLPTLQKSIGKMERKHDRLPTSPAYLAQCTVFAVLPSKAAIAIDYVDGDGGFLVAELVPGLTDYLDSRGLATLERFDDGDSTLVAFREFGHDAIELSHVYKRTDCHQTRHLGVESLRLARRLVAECDSLFVCTRGELDAFGKRLIVEVVTGKDGALTTNAQEQLTAGLSVPLRDAPAAYLECAARAEANGAGIFSIFPATVAKSPDMSPSALRQHFREGTTNQFVVSEGEAVCKVSTPSERRNDSHMTLYESNLPRAGCGLFGRCQPPPRFWEEGQAASSPVVIRKNDQVCLYSKHPLTTPVEQLPTADYVVAVEAFGRSRLYDASTYDGSNIGRFANDAGLMPGLKAMVRLSNRLCYPTGCDWRVVEETARQHCNAVFKSKGPTAIVLVATRDITLGRRSQEIFVSYGIHSYWVPCIASKIVEWGIDSEMVQALLWCVTSEQSNWPPDMRRQCLDDMRRVYPGIDNVCDVSCPWPELLGSTLPPRRARSGQRH